MKRIGWIITALFAVWGCSKDNGTVLPHGGGRAVTFSAGTVEIAPVPPSGDGTKAVTVQNLPANTTVRIFAYERRKDGAGVVAAKADAALDTYVGEGTFKVGTPGGDLVPCVLDDDGLIVAGTPQQFSLDNGTYDFYAVAQGESISQALRPQKEVRYGHDVMGMPVKTYTITNTDRSVTLNPLKHLGSRMSFVITKSAVNTDITSLSVDAAGVAMGNVTPGPAYAKLGDTVVLTQPTAVYTIPKARFAADAANAYTWNGSALLLPKLEGPFVLKFNLVVNGVTRVFKADMPSMSFKPGVHYLFRVELGQTDVTLSLTVAQWNQVSWSAPDIGQGGSVSVGPWLPGDITDPDIGQGGSLSIGSWNGVDWGADNPVGGGSDLGFGVGTWTQHVVQVGGMGGGADVSSIDAWVSKNWNDAMGTGAGVPVGNWNSQNWGTDVGQ